MNNDLDSVYNSLSKDELEHSMSVFLDPVQWAETFLKDPKNPSQPLRLWDYQKEMLRYQPIKVLSSDGKEVWKQRISAFRCGRRTGKSHVLVVMSLWKIFINRNFKVLIICPFENQVNLLFDMMHTMISDSQIFTPTRFVRKPYILEMSNGSSIHGYTAGVKSGQKGSSIRGTDGDLIIVDEMDQGIDYTINAIIIPIFTARSNIQMIGASNPSGVRGVFYDWCNSADKLGIKEFHIKSSDSPMWTKESEAFAKATTTVGQYAREYDAEFGDEEEGVYRMEDLVAIAKEYYYEDRMVNKKIYKGCINEYDPRNRYIMGVDWNDVYGIHITIVEQNYRNHRYRVFLRKKFDSKELRQLNAIDEIINLDKKYPCHYLYVDQGFGTVQIELLQKYGIEHPESGLYRKVKGIDSSSKIEIKDPVSGQMIRKHAKPFMVNNSAIIVENRELDIPEFENYEEGLLGLMQIFKVKKHSTAGVPIYDGGKNDHALMSLMLSLLGFTLEFSDWNQNVFTRAVGRVDLYKAYNTHQRYNINHFINEKKLTRVINNSLPGFRHYQAKPDLRIKERELSKEEDRRFNFNEKQKINKNPIRKTF